MTQSTDHPEKNPSIGKTPVKKKASAKKKATKKVSKKATVKPKSPRSTPPEMAAKAALPLKIPPGTTITEALGESFLTDLISDWQSVGATVIQECRTAKPDAYLRLVATYAPKEFRKTIQPYEEMDDNELEKKLRKALSELKEFGFDQGLGVG